MLYVVKRDGRKVEFDSIKITNAIRGSADEISYELLESQKIELTQKIIKRIEKLNVEEITVEEVQNIVQETLLENGHKPIGIAYANYRKERTRLREIKSDLMKAIEKIGVETDRDNANVGNVRLAR